MQLLSAFGGWATGDAEFIGPNPPDDAVITYFLQKRHIFGDMKLEVLDSTGKLVQTLPTSKRRGISRTAWSMRMTPPRMPPAAAAAFGIGPRFLPGHYTVKLTEGDSTYTTTLHVVGDARVSHAVADRQAQFDLAVKLYGLLESDDDGRRPDERRARLARSARHRPRRRSTRCSRALQRGSAQVDTMRKKIVATKEGGMITGEERLRENLAALYGSVVGYEGHAVGDAGRSGRRRSGASWATSRRISSGGFRSSCRRSTRCSKGGDCRGSSRGKWRRNVRRADARTKPSATLARKE